MARRRFVNNESVIGMEKRNMTPLVAIGMGKRNMAPLVVVGAVSAVGLLVALAGLFGNLIVDGALSLLVSSLALLITSIAVWYG